MDAINELLRRLNSIIELAQLGVWDFDPRVSPYYWSARAKSFFGLPADAEITRDLFLSAVHPYDRDFVIESLDAAMDPEVGSFAIEFRTIGLQDSVERFIEAQGKVEFVGQTPVRVVAATRDISRQRKLECELMSALQDGSSGRSARDASRPQAPVKPRFQSPPLDL